MPLITVELELTREAASFVEGIDEEGHVRSFDRDRYRFNIDRSLNLLTVDVDEKSWLRRLARSTDTAPLCKVRKETKVRKKCLTCKHPFEAEPQIRICTPCKSTSAWQDGEDSYALHL